jgi:hypothetical protein
VSQQGIFELTDLLFLTPHLHNAHLGVTMSYIHFAQGVSAFSFQAKICEKEVNLSSFSIVAARKVSMQKIVHGTILF